MFPENVMKALDYTKESCHLVLHPLGLCAEETGHGIGYPMGMREEGNANIVKRAVALESSSIAENMIFLYRGSHFQRDRPVSNRNAPYALSYGTSLFAGALDEGGAVAFYYMRYEDNNASVIHVPFEQIHRSPFYIPATNAISQLCGSGDKFHPRSKGWSEWEGWEKDSEYYDGFYFPLPGDKTYLKAPLTKKELTDQFKWYKEHAGHLKC